MTFMQAATRGLTHTKPFLSSKLSARTISHLPSLRGGAVSMGGHCRQEAFANHIETQRRNMSSTAHAGVESFITSTINTNKVTVFSKTYCPHCTRTKQLFTTLGEDAMIMELDERADGDAIQQGLARLTGQRSVPNVFVNGQHVGGNDDTQAAAQSGELQALLKSSPVL